MFAMSRDGLVPRWVGKLSQRQTPALITAFFGILVAHHRRLRAAQSEIAKLVNIGTLFAFLIVNIGVIVLRRTAARHGALLPRAAGAVVPAHRRRPVHLPDDQARGRDLGAVLRLAGARACVIYFVVRAHALAAAARRGRQRPPRAIPPRCSGGSRPVGIAGLELLAGVCVALFFTLWDLSIQEQIPAHAVSRVSAYDFSVSMGLMPLGMAMAGPIADKLGLQATLLGMSAIGLGAPTTRPRRGPSPGSASPSVLVGASSTRSRWRRTASPRGSEVAALRCARRRPHSCACWGCDRACFATVLETRASNVGPTPSRRGKTDVRRARARCCETRRSAAPRATRSRPAARNESERSLSSRTVEHRVH